LEGSVFFRKECNLFWLSLFLGLTKKLNGFPRRSFLASVEFAEVEDVALNDVAIGKALGLDHTPVEVLFAIFDSFAAT
jgi:hypothetical protein